MCKSTCTYYDMAPKYALVGTNSLDMFGIQMIKSSSDAKCSGFHLPFENCKMLAKIPYLEYQTLAKYLAFECFLYSNA